MSEQNSIKDKIINSKWFKKLKNIKHFDLIVIVIFCSVLLLIYFYDFSGSEKNKNSNEESTSTFVSYQSYTQDLENRLRSVLTNIKGVGKVSVMVTLDGSPELIIAYNIEEKSTGKSTSDTTIIKEPIIITQNGKSSPLILKEVLPKVKGVLIVAQGADNVSVKLNILDATVKLLDISANNVEIFAGE